MREQVAERYRAFAALEARGTSPLYEELALGTAADPRLLDLLDGLPRNKPSPGRLVVAWRAGIDLNPLDLTDPADVHWLRTLIWPEHADRARRLATALRIGAADPPRIVQGDLVERLPGLAAEAPADATLVVFHTAVLTYLPPRRRELFVQRVSALPGHWISQEAPAVLPAVAAALPEPVPTGSTGPARFVLALDGRPLAFTDPHGGQVNWFAQPSP